MSGRTGFTRKSRKILPVEEDRSKQTATGPLLGVIQDTNSAEKWSHRGVACTPVLTLTNETKSGVRTRVWTRETKRVQNFCGRNRVRACVRELPRKRKALLLL